MQLLNYNDRTWEALQAYSTLIRVVGTYTLLSITILALVFI